MWLHLLSSLCFIFLGYCSRNHRFIAFYFFVFFLQDLLVLHLHCMELYFVKHFRFYFQIKDFLILANTELFAVCLRVTSSVIEGKLAPSPPFCCYIKTTFTPKSVSIRSKITKKAVYLSVFLPLLCHIRHHE